MQSAPFLFVGEPGNFSLWSGGGQQAAATLPGGDATGRRERENMETIRGEAAVWKIAATVLAGISSCVTGIVRRDLLLLLVREALTDEAPAEGQKCLLRKEHALYIL